MNGDGLRLAAEAGLHFLRLLTDRGLSAYRKDYLARYRLNPPSEPERDSLDDASLRFWETMALRVPDGHRLYSDLSSALRPPGSEPSLPPEPIIKEADRKKIFEVAEDWMRWFEALAGGPATGQSSWNSERMEYEFAVAAKTTSGEVVLTAPEYSGGHLDWYSFNIHTGDSLGANENVERIICTAIPAPVGYPGMPSPRWWEFEDAKVDFGAVQADIEDLARLLMLEFAIVYGNDWFIVPVELKVGSICQVSSLVVADSFGDRLLVRAAGEMDGGGSGWSMFALSPERRGPGGRAKSLPLLFLPPVLAASLQSKPIEEVIFLRDEMANIAWAVERVVESRIGQPINRGESSPQERRKEQTRPRIAPLAYRLATDVPDHWYPLLPSPLQSNSFQFRLGSLPASSAKGEKINEPQSIILKAGAGNNLTIHEEELPRTGIQVSRAYQYARWIDGLMHIWIGRKKETARRQEAIGLRFDVVE
jgi:hypothetical protein